MKMNTAPEAKGHDRVPTARRPKDIPLVAKGRDVRVNTPTIRLGLPQLQDYLAVLTTTNMSKTIDFSHCQTHDMHGESLQIRFRLNQTQTGLTRNVKACPLSMSLASLL